MRITLETKHGKWECTPYQLEQAITLLLPASAYELRCLIAAHGGTSPTDWVSEALIQLCAMGVVDQMIANPHARRMWRTERTVPVDTRDLAMIQSDPLNLAGMVRKEEQQ